MYLAIYIPTYLSISLLTYLSPYLITYLFTYLPNYIFTYLPTYLPIYLPTYLPTYLLTYLFTYLPTYLSTYLSKYLPTTMVNICVGMIVLRICHNRYIGPITMFIFQILNKILLKTPHSRAKFVELTLKVMIHLMQFDILLAATRS